MSIPGMSMPPSTFSLRSPRGMIRAQSFECLEPAKARHRDVEDDDGLAGIGLACLRDDLVVAADVDLGDLALLPSPGQRKRLSQHRQRPGEFWSDGTRRCIPGRPLDLAPMQLGGTELGSLSPREWFPLRSRIQFVFQDPTIESAVRAATRLDASGAGPGR